MNTLILIILCGSYINAVPLMPGITNTGSSIPEGFQGGSSSGAFIGTNTAGMTNGIGPSFNPVVSCGSNSVQITINVDEVPAFANGQLFIGDSSDPRCMAETSGQLRRFTFDHSACKPTITAVDDNTLEYDYDIFDNTAAHALRNMITRHHSTSVQIKCSYPRNVLVTADYKSGVSHAQYYGNSQGNFNLSMGLYDSPQFTSPYPQGATVPVGTPVFAMVDANAPAQLVMYVQDCYATPSVTDVNPRYDLISSGGCFGKDQTFAPVQSAISPNSYGFQFDAFQFQNSPPGCRMYLTCNLNVCDQNAAQPMCQQPRKCSPGVTKRSTDVTFPITVGPFHVKEKEDEDA